MRQASCKTRSVEAAGYTLIELLIGIIILGVIASIGLPEMSGFLTSQKIEGNQRVLVSNLKYTQSEAVKRRFFVSMCIATVDGTPDSCDTTASASWNQGWHIFTDNNNDRDITTGLPDDDDNDVILKTQPAMPDVSIISATNIMAITFGATGQITTPAIQIEYSTCRFDSENLECQGDIDLQKITLLQSGQIVAI